MGRPPGQSDFDAHRTAEDEADRARIEAAGASPKSTRTMLWITMIALVLFGLLCMIGPHISGGG